jgi:hypothetical protein
MVSNVERFEEKGRHREPRSGVMIHVFNAII